MAPPGVVFLFDRPAPRGGARPVRYHNAIHPPLETDRGAQPSVGQVSSVVVLLSQGPAGANNPGRSGLITGISPALDSYALLLQREGGTGRVMGARSVPELSSINPSFDAGPAGNARFVPDRPGRLLAPAGG